jgi:hypothetical protein
MLTQREPGGVATRVAIATRVEGINLEDEAACGMG